MPSLTLLLSTLWLRVTQAPGQPQKRQQLYTAVAASAPALGRALRRPGLMDATERLQPDSVGAVCLAAFTSVTKYSDMLAQLAHLRPATALYIR